MRGARAGTLVKLRMEHWDGLWPEPGDYLFTKAGSAYLVDEIRPCKPDAVAVFTACCIKTTIVEAEGAIAQGARAFEVRWAKRRKHNRYPS